MTSINLHLISKKVTSNWFDHVPIFIMSLFIVDFIVILSLDFFRTDALSAKRVMAHSILYFQYRFCSNIIITFEVPRLSLKSLQKKRYSRLYSRLRA